MLNATVKKVDVTKRQTGLKEQIESIVENYNSSSANIMTMVGGHHAKTVTYDRWELLGLEKCVLLDSNEDICDQALDTDTSRIRSDEIRYRNPSTGIENSTNKIGNTEHTTSNDSMELGTTHGSSFNHTHASKSDDNLWQLLSLEEELISK